MIAPTLLWLSLRTLCWKEAIAFKANIWKLPWSNKVCSLRRRTWSMYSLRSVLSISKVLELPRPLILMLVDMSFYKQFCLAAKEISSSRIKVSALNGGSPRGSTIPPRDLCSCYPGLCSLLEGLGLKQVTHRVRLTVLASLMSLLKNRRLFSKSTRHFGQDH